MRLRMITLGALGAFAATGASAQAVGTQSWVTDLSGFYRCVRNCVGGRVVRIAQYGRELTLTNPAGQPATAWIKAPGYLGTSWKEGAVYSPDGFTIQFAGGTVWVLVDPTPFPGRVDY